MARDHDVASLSPRLPPPPFPMSVWSCDLLEYCRSPLCSLPLWSALELPMGSSYAEETVRDAWNQTSASSNPVIKILHWMLILWKKPKRLYSMHYFRVWWEAKIHSAKWIQPVQSLFCWRKSTSMWGSGRRKRSKVLYYAARHCSQTFVLRRNAGCGSST